MATFVILLDVTEFFFRHERGLKLFGGMLVNIKAGSCKINRK